MRLGHSCLMIRVSYFPYYFATPEPNLESGANIDCCKLYRDDYQVRASISRRLSKLTSSPGVRATGQGIDPRAARPVIADSQPFLLEDPVVICQGRRLHMTAFMKHFCTRLFKNQKQAQSNDYQKHKSSRGAGARSSRCDEKLRMGA